MLKFKLYDSTGELNEVKNGLYVHADVSIVNGSEITTPADPFLLCTSCTISYIFGVLPEYTAESTAYLTFDIVNLLNF